MDFISEVAAETFGELERYAPSVVRPGWFVNGQFFTDRVEADRAYRKARGYLSGRSMVAYHYHETRGSRGHSEVENPVKMRNIFAYTAPTPAEGYPEFISINRHGDEFTIIARGPKQAETVALSLPIGEAKAMYRALLSELVRAENA